MAKRQIVPAAGGAGLRLARGEHLRIIDLEGGQTGDLMAFSQDGRERLSNGRTFDYGGKIYLSTGDVLWSDRSNPMLTIVEDQVGRHDFLYSPCSLEMYRIQYRVNRLPRELPRQSARGAAGARHRAGFSADGVQFLHERRCSPRWAPQVRATEVSRWRLDGPARGNGSGDRAVGVSCLDLQRRCTAEATL